MTLDGLALPLKALLALFAAWCAITDWRTRRIPNWLTMSALAAAFAGQVWLNGWAGAKASLGGLGVALLIKLPLFLLRGASGGDVKMMAAAGAMTGAMPFIGLFAVNALVGGVAALGLAIAKGRLGATLRNTATIARELGGGNLPHRSHPELDVDAPTALTIPRGVVFAAAALLLLSVSR